MPVDDLWYLSQRGPDGARLKSRRHGRGKRWRCRYEDANGEPRAKFFERKADAEAWDVQARARVAPETQVDQSQRWSTYRDYAERWRASREIGQTLEYRRKIDSHLRHHHYPYVGDQVFRSITTTDVLEWLGKLLRSGAAQSSARFYYDIFNTIANAAVADGVIYSNPCKGVKISAVLRGLSRAPKWVPTTDDVYALLEVVPDRFRAAIWLGAGEGQRIGEVLAMEDSPRCIDHDSGEVHVVQQLRYHNVAYGGFYLAPPKAGSVGDVDLDDHVARALREHVVTFPAATVMLPDVTGGTPDTGKRPKVRATRLLFTVEGEPISSQDWSRMWARWRRAAGWPEEGTFHSLRHHFATALISAGADPTDVQKALRHSSLRITLETYVHWWPKKQRRRSVVGDALQAVRASRTE